ncbi:MAG: DivIVA domain-containing protein [Candidatus Krumholzibacteria bacterium]|nr:DivIVA domain-containing protein [Candidatus Krumholzibacteria bacterium]
MRITPLDVRKQEFRKGMRGLDPDEVYAFLATVADEYEAVLNDNKALRERVLELDDKVQEYRAMEKTLRDTLLTAERVTVDAKDNARREANLIIKEAQIEAEKALRDIKSEAMKLRQQIQQLRSQREAYLAKMRVVAQSHLQFVESAGTDFRDEDERGEDVAPERRRSTREDGSEPRATRALFDAPAVRERAGPQAAAPERPQTAPRRPVAPTAAAPAPPDRPVATAEPLSAPSPTGGAPSARERARGESKPLSDLSDILERMAEGQREVLQADHVVVEDAPNDFAPLRDADTPPPRPAPAGRARARKGETETPQEVTGEWSLEQIRRNIMASYDDESES